MTCDPARRADLAAFLDDVGVLADEWRAEHAAGMIAGAAASAADHNRYCSRTVAVGMGRCDYCGWQARRPAPVFQFGGILHPDPAAMGDAAFAAPPRVTNAAERGVAEDALERGEDPYEALAAYQRRPGPLADQPDLMRLVVAPGPGPHRQAWRMTAVGVWFAYAGEPCADFLPDGDPARPERVTAGELRARLAAR